MTIIPVLIRGDYHCGGEMSGVRSAPPPRAVAVFVAGGALQAGGRGRPQRDWRLRPGVVCAGVAGGGSLVRLLPGPDDGV